MAFIVDQQTNCKHYCKFCKKGFGCGRALGGHMRAHGIGDESANLDDDDQVSDWEDKLGGNVPPSNRRMYALRTNPNRLKSCRACENCGKEFFSWKSFLEHGKCSSADAESLVSSPGSDEDDGINGRRGCSGWSKRKRSLRAKVDGHFNFNSNCPSSEEEVDLANTLMMLSNGMVNHNVNVVAEPEESCASASKDEERRNPLNFMSPRYRSSADNKAKGVARKGLFECKACKKVFNSHQALGGHRASHKKVKGCFAARLDHIDDSFGDDDVITHEEFFPTKSHSTLQFDHGSNAPMASKRKSKVHECSICQRVFSSGQALGGHKRCHWITSNAPDTSTLARFHQFQEQLEHLNQVPKFDSEPLELKLDLNLPAPGDEATVSRRKNARTEIYLKPWVGAKEEDDDHGHSKKPHQPHYKQIVDDNNEDKNIKDSQTSFQNVDDEADSKVKLAKLSELKDMNLGSSSSPWLQVGLGSTVDVGTDS